MKRCPVCLQQRTDLFCRLPEDEQGRTWQIWRCRRCGHGATFPRPRQRELRLYYPTSYLGDSERMLAEFAAGTLQRTRSWRREKEKVALVERYQSDGGRILDVGASNGSFLLALDPGRWDRVGVEYIEEVVEMVQKAAPDITMLCGDVFAAPLDDATFDVITFWHVLEHLSQPWSVMQRVIRLLKPGGRVIISVPRFDSLQANFFKNHWYSLDVPRHLHHFSRDSLRAILARPGFEVEREYFFSRLYNFHQLKHSALRLSQAKFSTRIPYYLIKPLLFGIPLLESVTGRYGCITTIARKP